MPLPSDAFLKAHCRRIFFRNLRLSASIGIYPHEKAAPQMIALNCDVWTLRAAHPSARDSIEDVLDYDRIGVILRSVGRGHTDLQEALVDRLITEVAALPGVVLVRLSSEKLEAYPDAEAVGIEEWRAGASAPADAF